jgi:hypothetical protein
MRVENLPVELLYQIFKEIPRSTAYQCMLAREAFFQPALETYYSSLIISNNHIPFLNKKLLFQKSDQD